MLHYAVHLTDSCFIIPLHSPLSVFCRPYSLTAFQCCEFVYYGRKQY